MRTRGILSGLRNRSSNFDDIDPDEIFLDSQNLPAFNTHQFEGKIEKPISKNTVLTLGLVFFLVLLVFLSRIFYLEVWMGDYYYTWSQQNHLRHVPIFADRGVITDRRGENLASNVMALTTSEYSARKYSDRSGLSHLLGYVKYPARDQAGFFYKQETGGVDGVEKFFNADLMGDNGTRIIEVNARGGVESKSVISPPQSGKNLELSIDARVQEKLHELIDSTAREAGFNAGAGIIMDIHNGELIALVSHPEYESQILSDGADREQIEKYVNDASRPFLNRVSNGLYIPGSIVKPFVAIAALSEDIISPEKEILSTGSISIPNPYDPEKKSVFTDWKAHGYVNMREALAVSSNVYFYEIGGGFESQKGLGIGRIEKYFRLFGLGSSIGDNFLSGEAGTIPNPEWKKRNFDGEEWRIGDTYNTAIGQYGTQVTPIQVVRAVAAVANGGMMINPSIIKLNSRYASGNSTGVPSAHFKVVRDGMREAVLYGTGKGLDIPETAVAAKTGTAEIGLSKKYVNSWVIGFYPYQAPKYAFVVIMEKGPKENLIGGAYVMRQMFEWMSINTPEYL